MTGGRQTPGCNQRSRPPDTVDAQNARIRTASIVTGLEPESAQSGGLARSGPACRPAWQWRLVTGRCTRFHRAHEQTDPDGRGCANERLADSALVPCAAWILPGPASSRAARQESPALVSCWHRSSRG